MENKKNKAVELIEKLNSNKIIKNLGNTSESLVTETIIETEEPVIAKRNTYLPEDKLFESIGILDPDGKNINPLTGEPYKNLYYTDPSKEMNLKNATYNWFATNPGGWASLPMYNDDIKNTTIKSLYNNQVTLIVSGTGSGKTVLPPKYLLHVLNYQGKIAITNPKIKPAIGNAEFAAKCLDVALGDQVGLKFRNSPKEYFSRDSKLVFCTDGYILRKLQSDPLLSEYDAVVIDEAHERGIMIDLLLLMLKQMLNLRPDFKLVIMSATVNEKIFVDYFPTNKFKFGLVQAPGKPHFPVGQIFLKESINKFDENGNLINDEYIKKAAEVITDILRNSETGDVLVFFPGKGECQDGCVILHQKISEVNKNLDNKIYCNILHSGTDEKLTELLLNSQAYKNINNGRYTRKVIFATEVAESSLTIKGIDFVVDSGLVNENIFYSEKNLHSLEQKYISKASHTQRMGRTGRTAPGTCYNLFTENEYEKMFKDYRTAPILVDDISQELLYFISNKNFVSHIDFPFKYVNGNKRGGANIIVKTESEKNVSIENGNKKVKVDVKEEKTNVKMMGTSLANFLNGMIERPQEDKVKRTLQRLLAIGAIDMNGNVGTVSDMGRGMSCFGFSPEISRMLISGYNYHCREDMVNLAALLEKSENRIDGIFEKFSPSSKDPEIKEKEKAYYDKVKRKWANSLGDHFSLLDIYNNFCERKYDQFDRSGRIIKQRKSDEEVREWCKANFLNYRKLGDIRKAAEKIDRAFREVIHIFYEKHPGEKPTHLFIKNEPVISEKQEENIIRALIEGFYINLVKRVGERRYIDCFPEKKEMAGLSMDSLYAAIKAQGKYGFYTEFKSIFGRMSYAIVSKVPPGIIEQLQKSDMGNYVASCWKTMVEEKEEKKKGDKHHKKDHKKDKFYKKHRK